MPRSPPATESEDPQESKPAKADDVPTKADGEPPKADDVPAKADDVPARAGKSQPADDLLGKSPDHAQAKAADRLGRSPGLSPAETETGLTTIWARVPVGRPMRRRATPILWARVLVRSFEEDEVADGTSLAEQSVPDLGWT